MITAASRSFAETPVLEFPVPKPSACSFLLLRFFRYNASRSRNLSRISFITPFIASASLRRPGTVLTILASTVMFLRPKRYNAGHRKVSHYSLKATSGYLCVLSCSRPIVDPSLNGFGDMQVIHGSSSHRDGISASYWEAEKSVKDADDDSATRLWSSLQVYRIRSPRTLEWLDQGEGYQRRSSSMLVRYFRIFAAP